MTGNSFVRGAFVAALMVGVAMPALAQEGDFVTREIKRVTAPASLTSPGGSRTLSPGVAQGAGGSLTTNGGTATAASGVILGLRDPAPVTVAGSGTTTSGGTPATGTPVFLVRDQTSGEWVEADTVQSGDEYQVAVQGAGYGETYSGTIQIGDAAYEWEVTTEEPNMPTLSTSLNSRVALEHRWSDSVSSFNVDESVTITGGSIQVGASEGNYGSAVVSPGETVYFRSTAGNCNDGCTVTTTFSASGVTEGAPAIGAIGEGTLTVTEASSCDAVKNASGTVDLDGTYNLTQGAVQCHQMATNAWTMTFRYQGSGGASWSSRAGNTGVMTAACSSGALGTKYLHYNSGTGEQTSITYYGSAGLPGCSNSCNHSAQTFTAGMVCGWR